MSDNLIAINFSPLKTQDFDFSVFRKLKGDEEKKDFNFVVQQRELPTTIGSSELATYWVVFHKEDNFDEFVCNSNTNIYLTIEYLNHSIANQCHVANLIEEEDYFIQRNRIAKENNDSVSKVFFINENTVAGKQCIWVKGGYLDTSKEFGLYSDFAFRKKKDFKDFKLIQKMSLSLNNYGYSNTNFYSDRYEQLIKFAKKNYERVFLNSIIDFDKQKELPNSLLNTKKYIFKDGVEGDFAVDMKKKFPNKGITNRVKIYFVLAKDEKVYIKNAYEKINSILSEIYKIKPEYERFEIENISIENLRPLISKICGEVEIDNTLKPLVFFTTRDTGMTYYYECKYHFDINNIPIQFARYQTLKNVQNQFAYDGIVLQIFTKLGGIPWEMKPTNDNCLIVGLAQSNSIRTSGNNKIIKRHFAYSVLLNSRGVYKSLEVFSNEATKEEYLEKLRIHIEKIISEYANEYKKIVIHTPFKIKNDELEKIHKAIQNSNRSDIEFVVIRINTDNDYFGYCKPNNSLIPFESSTIKIGSNQFLVWFEGLKNLSDNPSKRISGPCYIEFHFPLELSEEQKYSYLQDIINLSGANWRGFKAKSQPISVYYCKLVTDFIRQFKEIGLSEANMDFKNIQPWFL